MASRSGGYDAAWLAQQIQKPGYGLVEGGQVLRSLCGMTPATQQPPKRRKNDPESSQGQAYGVPGPVTIILSPLRTFNPTNGTTHLRAQMRRAKQERQLAYWWLHHWLPTVPAVWPACMVLLTRIAPRFLDDDNLQAALKHIRDGVADWWDSAPGHGNDRQPALSWVYEQQKGKPHVYEVAITLSPMRSPHAPP